MLCFVCTPDGPESVGLFRLRTKLFGESDSDFCTPHLATVLCTPSKALAQNREPARTGEDLQPVIAIGSNAPRHPCPELHSETADLRVHDCRCGVLARQWLSSVVGPGRAWQTNFKGSRYSHGGPGSCSPARGTNSVHTLPPANSSPSCDKS